ncbi:MAG: diguanylate cyclase, partial [bacterium]
MSNYHNLLARQIKKFLHNSQDPPKDMENFLSKISDTYFNADDERKLLERSLEISSQELIQRNSEINAIFKTLPDVLLCLDKKDVITSYKFTPDKFYLSAEDAIIGRSIKDIHDESIGDQFKSALDEMKQKNSMVTLEYALTKNGTQTFYEARLQPLLVDQAMVMIRDITSYKKILQDLSNSEHRYAIAAEGSNDGLWDWDLVNNEIYYSPRWKKMLGLEVDEMGSSPKEWFSRIHADDIRSVTRTFDNQKNKSGDHVEIEYRMLHENGTYFWVLTRGIAVTDSKGIVVRMAGSQTDITQKKNDEEQLRYDTLHDKLTGLPNRNLVNDRLSNLIERSKRYKNTLFAVLFIDLDRFKHVNDSLGHIVGDQLLLTITRQLKSCLRTGDTLARFGGDEFIILLEDIANHKEVKHIV